MLANRVRMSLLDVGVKPEEKLEIILTEWELGQLHEGTGEEEIEDESDNNRTVNFTSVNALTDYRLIFSVSSFYPAVFYYDSNYNYLGFKEYPTEAGISNYNFKTVANTKYIRVKTYQDANRYNETILKEV